jgi:hypothetical protein
MKNTFKTNIFKGIAYLTIKVKSDRLNCLLGMGRIIGMFNIHNYTAKFDENINELAIIALELSAIIANNMVMNIS